MILANVREGLTSADLDLVVRLLSQGDAGREARYRGRLAEQGRDALLDDPSLFRLLCQAPGIAAPSAQLFIYVAVRHALLRVEIDDRELGDYLSALVLEFGVRDRAHRISAADDQVYRYVSDIVADLESVADARRAFLLRAHLGNFSLWLAGVFPDHIAARRERHGGPDVRYYEEMGAQGFRLASDHQLAREWDLTQLYQRAAASFERLRVGLNRLADSVFFPTYSSPDRLVRQVTDTFSLGLADN